MMRKMMVTGMAAALVFAGVLFAGTALAVDCDDDDFQPCWNPVETPGETSQRKTNLDNLVNAIAQRDAPLFAWEAAITDLQVQMAEYDRHLGTVEAFSSSAATRLALYGYALDGSPVVLDEDVPSENWLLPTDSAVEQVRRIRIRFRALIGKPNNEALNYLNQAMVTVARARGPNAEDYTVPVQEWLSNWNAAAALAKSLDETVLKPVETYLTALADEIQDARQARATVEARPALHGRIRGGALSDLRGAQADYDHLNASYQEAKADAARLKNAFSAQGALGGFANEIAQEAIDSSLRTAQALRIEEFMLRFKAEQLLASVGQLRHQDLMPHRGPSTPAPPATPTQAGERLGTSVKTSGTESIHFRFDPDFRQMGLCIGPTPTTDCVYNKSIKRFELASGITDAHAFRYAYSTVPQILYNERPFTRNAGHVLTTSDATGNVKGFATVGVWDDLYSDLSLDGPVGAPGCTPGPTCHDGMTNSWAYYGHWMQAPPVRPTVGGRQTGPIVQMGSFVGIERLGDGSDGQSQAFFSLPAQDIAPDTKYVFKGDAQGLYAAGQSVDDVSAGTFEANVRLEYQPGSGGAEGKVTGLVDGFRYQALFGATPGGLIDIGTVYTTRSNLSDGTQAIRQAPREQLRLAETAVPLATTTGLDPTKEKAVAEGNAADFEYFVTLQRKGDDPVTSAVETTALLWRRRR